MRLKTSPRSCGEHTLGNFTVRKGAVICIGAGFLPLHISGKDGALLEDSLRGFVQGHVLKMSAVPASLEDVFIHLMQGSEDQFKG